MLVVWILLDHCSNVTISFLYLFVWGMGVGWSSVRFCVICNGSLSVGIGGEG